MLAGRRTRCPQPPAESRHLHGILWSAGRIDASPGWIRAAQPRRRPARRNQPLLQALWRVSGGAEAVGMMLNYDFGGYALSRPSPHPPQRRRISEAFRISAENDEVKQILVLSMFLLANRHAGIAIQTGGTHGRGERTGARRDRGASAYSVGMVIERLPSAQSV